MSSAANPAIKAVARLRKKRGGQLLIDGARALSLALAGGVRVEDVFLSEAATLAEQAAARAARAAGARLTPVAAAIFDRIAYGNAPDGIVAVAEAPDCSLERLTVPDAPLILVLAGLEKPGNLGALLRTADAVGVDAVIVAEPASDPLSPNVVRASRGTLFTVPVAVADAASAIAWLEIRHIPIAAAVPDAATLYTRAPLGGAVAIALGAEHAGLPPVWKAAASLSVTIPMRGRADSLNVATSGAVLLYEALRQRGAG
ncbi:MAG: RNA methyltransferase [Nitrospirae bacterium]|nr:RNA methyltransferase [Nitrospirota bacterium]